MRIGLKTQVVLALALLLQAGCATLIRPPAAVRATQVTPFSAGAPGGAWPGGWREQTVVKLRRPSRYALIDDGGITVVEARAEASASGLVELLNIDPHAYPMLVWRWKVTEPVEGADTTRREREDAAVRVMVSFDGDVQKLPLSERLFFEQARALSGLAVPYATLEYVWGNGAPKETVVINAHTSRIRIVLAQSGERLLGQWVTEVRDVVADFRRAFAEEPGRINAIAIYTDADATGKRSQGYYGDIAFVSREQARHLIQQTGLGQ